MTDEKLTLTRSELITIIEDAFIDGWNQQDNDWAGSDYYLKKHKKYGDGCETTIVIDNLKAGV